MFIYTTKIRLHHTDAVGRIFFNQIFILAHECYEDFLSNVYPTTQFRENSDFQLPIVHTEADYHLPLKVGQAVTITMSLERLGNSSFHLLYEVKTDQGVLGATVKTSHVCVSRQTQNPIEVPNPLREALTGLG